MIGLHLVRNPSRLTFIAREMNRVGGVTPESIAYVKRHGLNLGTVIAKAGFLTVALAKFYGDNSGDASFSFDVDGVPSAVIEANIFDYRREIVTADYVAWPLHRPEDFATAMGVNDGADVLGPENMVQRHGAPLYVHTTPLEWLKADCEGCVVLKPGGRHWLHKAGGPFVCSGVGPGRELRRLLGGRHQILVPEKARAA